MCPQTATLRLKLAKCIRKRLDLIQRCYHEELAELSFIQSGALLIDFHGWRSRRSQELMQALCSGHLDPEDLSLISDYMSGRIAPESFFPPCGANPNQIVSEADADSEGEDRGLDETSIFRFAMRELNVLKRVVELKKAGLWSVSKNILDAPELVSTISTPSMSSLAPPPENTARIFSDYLFAELQWLAEDYKRERQWKKSSAKKLALAAVKAYREKTERSIKAEREEAVRIVHAKQQARLAVKRQQAITTHLGRVLETTEEYTRWLTEGIAGTSNAQSASTGVPVSDSTSDMPESEVQLTEMTGSPSESGDVLNKDQQGNRKRKRVSTESTSSDSEFTADEETLAAAEDDEETIAREEEEAKNDTGDPEVSAQTELAQLAADADCPIEDLIPPGYLEACVAESPCKPEDTAVSDSDADKQSVNGSDQSYEAGTNEVQLDDESTIDAQERHERRLRQSHLKEKPSDSPSTNEEPINHEEEIAQLQREAEMPLDVLLKEFAKHAEESMDVEEHPSDSELTSSTQGSDTTTSSGEESDDDRTTLTDTSSTTSEPSLRELICEEIDNASEHTNKEQKTEELKSTIKGPQEAVNLPGDPRSEEVEKNLEVSCGLL
ncbi:unnamed protein product [Echinostoma caproni]|uniref:HSA domain-containing protein n=1 Tax=Echinostoma caproni TaxID=27848 RepID=A0A183AZ97_9TREM|nr:unnamed protein product [Echinostoma caproni]